MLFKYKILAFVTLIKKHRKNSMIFCNESEVAFAKKLGISYNAYKKYRTFCINNDILVSYGDHKQFISLLKVVEILKLDINKYIKFFHYKRYEELTFKNIYQQIQDELVLQNYKQQKYHINKKSKELSFVKKAVNSKRSPYRRTKEVLKKYGSLENAISSITDNFTEEIVSGKSHVSNIVGCSDSTGHNILTRLATNGKIIKETKTLFFKQEVNHFNFDALKYGFPNQVVIPSNSLVGFTVILGSSIVLL